MTGSIADLAHGALDELELVPVVVDDERGGEPQQLRYRLVPEDAAKNHRRRGVEGAHHQLVRLEAEELDEPLAHLARGLVGEGDGEDAPRRDAAHLDQVGHPAGDDARLAAARAGQHEERAIPMEDRFPLGLVQVFEEFVGVQGRVLF